MDTVQKGKIADIFSKDGADKITPVFLLHGLTGTRTTQSGSCRDFASFGHIVFSITHHDGTAAYSVLENGEEKFWSSNHEVTDKELRKGQTKIRVAECKTLMDEIFDPKFPQEKLGFNSNV